MPVKETTAASTAVNSSLEESSAAAKRSDIRVDAAHAMATESAAASTTDAATESVAQNVPSGPGPLDEETPARLIQHVRRQAEQLAVHLRAQQRELDHRESFLNAREAQVEQQMRAARLWLGERQAELRERQAAFESHHRQLEADRLGLQTQLDALQNEQSHIETAHHGLEQERLSLKRGSTVEHQTLAQRLTELEKQRGELARKQEGWHAAQEQFTQRQQALEALQQMLTQRESELVRREKELAEQANQDRNFAAEAAAAEYQSRKQQLDEAESLLTDALSELEANRQHIASDRDRVEKLTRTERRQLAESHRATELETQRKKEALQRRSEQLDARQAALEQMRADLTRLHRETLEMRLAVEETWAQLSGMAAPAVVTQTLSRIRNRLADRYRLETEELAAQRESLASLGVQIGEQHDKLTQQKRDFQQWAVRQQEETERQAAELSARESELEQTTHRCEDLQQKWHAERRHYQQEIRRLLGELRREPQMAAAY